MSMSQVGSGLPRLLAERYELAEQLASGSMTSVWRGHDRVLGRDVVVKVLHPELAADQSLRSRFHQEAVNAARLTHPNIVALYDTGEQEGVNYIVMELVEGPTLRDVLSANGPLPPGRAARLACEVVYALEYAHQAGVVHRNLKPANILLGGDGSVKVGDFSIARAATDDDTGHTGHTGHTGELLAASPYLAPELADGVEPDGRADVYGVGACLFEMLTGRPPAGAQGQGAGVLSPRAIRAGVPRELDAVVQRAMASDPSNRYPNAQAMASALARSAMYDHSVPAPLATTPPPLPPPPPELAPAPGFLRHEGRWLGWTLVLVGLVAALVVVGLTLSRSGVLPLKSPADEQQSTNSTARQAVAVKVAGAQAYDPFGKPPEENDSDASNAVDGNPSTSWKTEHYNSAKFGSLKQGVGLMLDAGSPKQVGELDLQLLYGGADVEVYGAADAPPSDFEGWSKLGGKSGTDQRNVKISLSDSDSYRYYLVWFTQLPPAPDGQFQEGIAEAGLKS
ncbi:MAG TPA: protein kinase [Actinomycetes bacterium]|jgi:serine/threonine protein kinase|nr:protein kinase [Actinomycetes bacterium]